MRQLMNVIVVEDSPEDREQVRRFLARDPLCDYQLSNADTGRHGLELARSLRADCIIIDFNLPDMTGLELVQEIKQLKQANLAMIILTGQGSEDIAVVAMQEGVQDYVVKNTLTSDKLQSVVRNAIEHIRIQNALRENQELVQAVIDASTSIIFVRDIEGHFLLINRQFEVVFNLGRILTKGTSSYAMVPSETAERWLANDHSVIEQGRAIGFEERFLLADGIHTFLVMTFPLYTISGVLYAVCSMATDITERKQAEEELYRRKQEFQALTENSPDVIARFDREYRHLYVNPAVTHATGRRPEEFIGKTNRDLSMPDEQCRLWDESLERVFTTGQENTYAFSFAAPDGTRYYQRKLVPEYNSAGLITSVLSVARDISEVHRAEHRFQFLAELNGVISTSLDAQTIYDSAARCIVSFIADVCLIHILDAQDSVQRVAADAVDENNRAIMRITTQYEDTVPNAEHAARTILKTGEAEIVLNVANAASYHADRTLINPVGDAGIRAYMKLPLIARNQTFGVLAVGLAQSNRWYTADDVTMMRDVAWRMAIALDNAQLYKTAQQAVKERDAFLSVASHELKTPLTALHGFVQLLARRLNKQGSIAPDQLRHALVRLDQQTNKLKRLISQLLDISRLEARGLTLELQNVDLIELANRTTELMQALTQRHTIRINAAGEILMLADADRLEQVLMNLLDNAIKYSPNGGQIDVEISTQVANIVRICVRDFGVGIPKDRRDHIFERFYQAHGDGYLGGLGLGLYVCGEIVGLHGGTIAVEFPNDGGTQFVIDLPHRTLELA